MLKNLTYETVEPTPMVYMIAKINKVELGSEKEYFQHYTTGIYRHDGYAYNFEKFIKERCKEKILNRWVAYGVCDDYSQVVKAHSKLFSDPAKKYVIGLTTVKRENQTEDGWKWDGWGQYIGTQNPEHEYIYHDKHIDTVYCYRIFEIE